MIYERIQVFGHFPDALFAAAQAAVLPLFPQHEVQGLVRVVLATRTSLRNREFHLFFESHAAAFLEERASKTSVYLHYRAPESAVHAEPLREDSSTAEMNRMPSTPSAIPGTRSDSGSGDLPSCFAVICSARSL